MRIKNILLAAIGLMLSQQVLSHGRWIIPSHFIISGDKPAAVAADMSISNDFFHPDYGYGGEVLDKRLLPPIPDNPRSKIIKTLMASTRMAVQSPDGDIDKTAKLVNFGRKSTSAAVLSQSGTYKLSVRQNPIYFTWYKDANGELNREFGTLEETRKFLPKGATEIRGSVLHNHVLAYVTRNDVTPVKPVGDGLDVVFETHPNELFVGEKAKLTLLLNGSPVDKGVKVTLTRNDTRYRNNREEIEAVSDNKGSIMLDWPEPGVYLLQAEVKAKSSDKSLESAVYALYLTLEINPE